MPKDLLPAWMQHFATYNPLTYLSDAIRGAYLGHILARPLLLALLTTVALGVATQLLIVGAERKIAVAVTTPAGHPAPPYHSFSQTGRPPWHPLSHCVAERIQYCAHVARSLRSHMGQSLAIPFPRWAPKTANAIGLAHDTAAAVIGF